MPFTLCCVAVVLHHQPSAAALQHLGPLISEYLGPSAHLSLREACTFGSLQLVDWIWETSPTTCTKKTQGWALTNYLRSNPHYYAYQFGRSLKAAVNSNNLVVAEWIFDHFSGCIVTADIVELAAEKGLLSVLQFFHDHDAGRSELVDGLRGGNIIRWSGDSIVKAIAKEQASVAWWLYKHSRQDVGEDAVTRFVQAALEVGDIELTERLVPEGKDLLEYSRYCFHPQVIERMLERGATGDNTLGHYGNSLRNLMQHGRLDLIQRVAELRAAARSSGENFLYYWYEAIMSASRHDLGIFRWLVDHPIGRELKTSAYRNFCHILCELSQLGHVEAMQLLYDYGATDPCSCAMGNAVYAGHLDAVKWLIRSFPEAWKSSSHRFTRDAAQYGHLDILQYFLEHDWARFGPDRSDEARSSSIASSLPAGALIGAGVRSGKLNVVEWLHVNHPEACSSSAMDFAAAEGHLDVVEWMYANTAARCTTEAMNLAASRGFMAMVQWLHENCEAGWTSAAVDAAAESGYFSIIKWLHSKRPEACTANALVSAVRNWHFRIVCWLHAHCPELAPKKLEMSGLAPVEGFNFEVLLFLHAQYPEMFTSEFVGNTRYVSYRRRWLQT